MEQRTAFVPGHISGFFQMYDEPENPLREGSRNCGFCISNGVRTEVKVDENSASNLQIFVNGKEDNADTTRTAVNDVLNQVGNEELFIQISHQVQAPIGSGYGMSGAGTLGAVLALSEALNLDLSEEEILAKAHKAEVTCKSGLGDVAPQMLGGVVIGIEPGAPPFGNLERISVERELDIVCATLGSLSTSGVLNSPGFREKSRELGEKALVDLLSDKSVKNLMRISRRFAIDLGVFDEEFVEILEKLSSRTPLGASAVLLGKAIFAPVPSSDSDEVKTIFSDYFEEEQLMITSVDFEGAKLEDNKK